MDKKCLLALVQSCHKPTCMIRYSSEKKKKSFAVREVKHVIYFPCISILGGQIFVH